MLSQRDRQRICFISVITEGRSEKNKDCCRSESHFHRFSPFNCCLSVVLLHDKGDYSKNSHVVFRPNGVILNFLYVWISDVRSINQGLKRNRGGSHVLLAIYFSEEMGCPQLTSSQCGHRTVP